MPDKKLISKALALYHRAYYAFHLNTVLSVTFGERKKDINEWIKGREHHHEFFADYQRLMVRTLVIELCVMFEKNERDRKKQYSIYSLLRHFSNVAPSNGNLFLREDQIEQVDCKFLLRISPELHLPRVGRSEFIASTLLEEYNLYIEKNRVAVEELKRIRDGYIAHPDATHEITNVQVSHLKGPSEWCFSFVSLLLHLLTFSGGRPYVSRERCEFVENVRNSQNLVLNDILS